MLRLLPMGLRSARGELQIFIADGCAVGFHGNFQRQHIIQALQLGSILPGCQLAAKIRLGIAAYLLAKSVIETLLVGF